MPHVDPEKMHSLGFSFTVSQGVTVMVSEANEGSITFNDWPIEFPTVKAVAEKLSDRPLRIEIASPLPLSCGFGLSGASALATAYATNTLLYLDMSDEALAKIAHIAEVENLTGLGDVCAQFHGGCLVKVRKGDPLAAQQLGVPEQAVYYRYFSPIHTRDVLSDPDQKRAINEAADSVLAQFAELTRQETVQFDDCLRLSLKFARESGLLRDPQVRETINAVEAQGGCASMIMLGNAVFSSMPFAGAEATTISHRGVYLIP